VLQSALKLVSQSVLQKEKRLAMPLVLPLVLRRVLKLASMSVLQKE